MWIQQIFWLSELLRYPFFYSWMPIYLELFSNCFQLLKYEENSVFSILTNKNYWWTDSSVSCFVHVCGDGCGGCSDWWNDWFSFQISVKILLHMHTLCSSKLNFSWPLLRYLQYYMYPNDPSFWTDKSGQTVQAQSRMAPKELSDPCLHSLPFWLHLKDALVTIIQILG